MEPVIKALREDYGNEVEFIIVDVRNPDNQLLLQQYSAQYVPAYFFIDNNGEVVDKYSGGASKSFLEDKITALID